MSFLVGGAKTTSRADKIAKFQSTACDFGTPLGLAYGTCKLSPNLINWQDFTSVEKKTTTKTGKHSSATNIDYSYYVYAELALCEGVIDGIGKVYSGDDTFNSLAEFNANSSNEGSPLSLNVGNNPEPTAYMSSKHPELAVGYSNMAYLYGYIFLGTNAAGIPSYSFEVLGQLRSGGDGTDANAADVIRDMLRRVGYESYIDAESFNNFRLYCAETGLLVSSPGDAFASQQKCQEYVKALLALCNTYMFWSTDRFKFVPRDDRPRGSWRPDTHIRYNITERDMKAQSNGACVSYTRKDSSEIYNRWGVSFINRANGYEEETVFFEDTDDIRAHGARTAPDFSAKWIHTKERAVIVASMQARMNRTETVKYTFKLGWGVGSLLEPGDLITLTDGAVGIEQQLCMVESITEDAAGLLTVNALRRDAASSGVSYDVVDSDYNTMNYNADPGNTAAPLVITPPQELVTAASGIEVWLGLQGETKDWGGCNVYASTKDGAYTLYDVHKRNSSYGYTLTSMAADSTSVDVHFTNASTVTIIEGSVENADADLTDIWINGECMSYTASQLIGPNSYRLSGLRRGKYSSGAKAHAIGDGFAVLNGELFCVQLTKNYLDQTLYLKFPSFNTFEKNPQSVNDVDYYTHIVKLYDIPNVIRLSVTPMYEESEETDLLGFTHTVITRRYAYVTWAAPDWPEYMNARVYYKQGSGAWMFAGTGATSLTFDVSSSGDYTVAVCTQDLNGYSETPDDSTQTTVTFI